MKIEYTGIKQLDKKLADMPDLMRRKPMRRGTREVAKFTLRQAKREAPHDEGDLERSLKVKSAKRSRKLKGLVGATVETSEGMFQGDQFYGGMVEFGTDNRKTKSGANRGKIEKDAFAFLRPSLYAFPDRKRRIFIAHIARWMREQRAKK